MTRPAEPPAEERHDVETRRRLLAVATRLFSERGFHHVTVRDICAEARANVAAVNYHFGDKARLYRVVVDAALAAVRPFIEETTLARPGARPEAKLRHYIAAHVARSVDSSAAGGAAIIRGLFRHEMAEPTELAPLMFEQALTPRLRYLASVVASLLGPGARPDAVQRCVMSIHLQCLSQVVSPHLLGTPPARRPDDQEALIEHIFEFSLAGIRAAAARARRRRRPL